MIVVIFFALQLAEEDAFDSEKDAASVAYNAAVKGAAKVGFVCWKHASQAVCAPGTSIHVPVSLVCVCVWGTRLYCLHHWASASRCALHCLRLAS
jgi:hypothetical protein